MRLTQRQVAALKAEWEARMSGSDRTELIVGVVTWILIVAGAVLILRLLT